MLTQDCVNKLGMIKPITHPIGKYTGHYVLLTGVLRMLVQKEDILPYVPNQSTSDDGHLTDYNCGDAWKKQCGECFDQIYSVSKNSDIQGETERRC